MPEFSHEEDERIIQMAYAERVKDSFKVFAENLAMGENEKTSRERFLRALEWTRKARDLALAAMAGTGFVEPTAAGARFERSERAGAPLTSEEQAMVDQALSGTTGHRAPPAPYRR